MAFFLSVADLDIAESIDDTARYFTLWVREVACSAQSFILGNG